MHIGICDDDINIINELERYLIRVNSQNDKKQDIVVEKFSNAFAVLDYIENSNETLDVIFLDIVYGSENGISIGEKIQERQKNIKIVFITGYINYVEDIFNIVPFAILIKPFTFDKVSWIWNKVVSAIEAGRTQYVMLKTKDGIYSIDIKDIIYIESRGRYLRISVEEQLERLELTVRMTMNDIEEKLNDLFVKCHRSYFINIMKIRKISKYEVVLSDKSIVPVSRPNYKMIYDRYMEVLTQ